MFHWIRFVMLLVLIQPLQSVWANPPPWAHDQGRSYKEYKNHKHEQRNRHKREERHERYTPHHRHSEPVRLTRSDPIWRGPDHRYYCRRSDGTTGLLVGAGVGALIGHSIDEQNRTLGTLIGAAGGALIGKALDEGSLQCR